MNVQTFAQAVEESQREEHADNMHVDSLPRRQLFESRTEPPRPFSPSARPVINCERCGRRHRDTRRSCSAITVKFALCGLRGHYSMMCKEKRRRENSDSDDERIFTLKKFRRDSDRKDDRDEGLQGLPSRRINAVFRVNSSSEERRKMKVLFVKNRKVDFLVDTGAELSCLTVETVRRNG